MELLKLCGVLTGHNGWVTQIVANPKNNGILFSSSRDKSIIIWKLVDDKDGNCGYPLKRLYGHSHFISDIAVSFDGQYVLSGSWDRTLRLWDTGAGGKTMCRFEGHTKDVLSVAFSADSRQIVSGSRDKSIILWNTLGQCKFVVKEDCHTDWVSCVRFSPNYANPTVLSCGWDSQVKIWNLANFKLKHTHHGHNGYINTVVATPDGTLCASGGKDAKVLLWELEYGNNLMTLEHNAEIHAMCFSGQRFWLAVASGPIIKLWDLVTKQSFQELRTESASNTANAKQPHCLSLAWSADCNTLFAGYTDKIIRLWKVAASAS